MNNASEVCEKLKAINKQFDILILQLRNKKQNENGIKTKKGVADNVR